MNSAEFSLKMGEVRAAMENEEWSRAIRELEKIGEIPDKFLAVASGILLYLYLSRNHYEKLVRLAPRFDPAKSKDCVSALLLLRNQKLDYPIKLPAPWEIETWEQAIEEHARAGCLEPAELSLCLFFLSYLNRPKLLEQLHALSVASGGALDDESVGVVMRSYLKNQWFEAARSFLWRHNLNDIAFERFNFLIDRAERQATEIPDSTDKVLSFLRYRFGDHMPLKNLAPASAA